VLEDGGRAKPEASDRPSQPIEWSEGSAGGRSPDRARRREPDAEGYGLGCLGSSDRKELGRHHDREAHGQSCCRADDPDDIVQVGIVIDARKPDRIGWTREGERVQRDEAGE
jgi:hypothetical protein